jgi:hypothetical protein
MATYESHFVMGWRTRLKEASERLEREMWGAPSRLLYIDGTSSADGNALLGHTPWFQRVYGPEREAAKARLAEHSAEKKRIRKAEEIEDQREEQRERQRRWRDSLPPEKKKRVAKNRAERERINRDGETEEQRELRRERQRRWRAKLSPEKTQQYKMTALARIARQDPEWHDRELEKRRKRKDARRDQYNATDRLSAQPRSGARNAKKREAYAMNPEHFCEQERARRAANPEHVRAMARAAYVRRKLNQRAPG